MSAPVKIEFPCPAGELTPHEPPMLLLDEVTLCAEGRIRATTTIRADNIFFMPGRGLPGYVGFEIMAQTIAAYDGWTRRLNGEKPAIGFLLGCRKYQTAVEWFAEGDVLNVESVSLLAEGEMRSFDCRITSPGGALLASSTLNVFRPENPEEYLSGARAPGVS